MRHSAFHGNAMWSPVFREELRARRQINGDSIVYTICCGVRRLYIASCLRRPMNNRTLNLAERRRERPATGVRYTLCVHRGATRTDGVRKASIRAAMNYFLPRKLAASHRVGSTANKVNELPPSSIASSSSSVSFLAGVTSDAGERRHNRPPGDRTVLGRIHTLYAYT